MPPKRRRESNASDSDLEGSLAVPRKKVNAGSTELRRTTSDETLSSDERLSSEGVLVSDKPLSSELSSSEDESDASTNQGATSQTDPANASPSTDTEHQSNPDAQDAPAQAVQRNGDKIWEILNGDERTSMAVGVAAPNRLKLRLRNRNTDEIREFNYKKGDAAVIRKIDWHNRDHIEDIGKWRNQIFNRLKFPIRKTTRWSDEEVLFLTLAYEKIALAAAQTKRISLPSYDSVIELFIQTFGDVRERDIIVQRIRRKDKSRLAELKAGVDSNPRPEGGPEYQLTIAPGELEAYMERRHVRLVFDRAEYERITKAEPEVGKAEKTPKIVKRKHKESSGKPAVEKTKTGRVVKTRKTRRPVRVVESDEESTGSDEQEFVQSDQQGPAGSGGHDDTPEWPHRHLVPAPKESNLRNDPSRTAHEDHDREAAQKKLVEARTKWLSTVMQPSAATDSQVDPSQPSAHPQQPDAQTVEREASPEAEDWLGTAYVGLHDRIERIAGSIPLAHGYTGRNGHRQGWYKDAESEDEAGDRVKGAQAVNALLNSAIVPPVEYHGDVRALVRERRLPEDQMRLHELGQSAVEIYHAAHDKEHTDNEEIIEDGSMATTRIEE